MNRFELAEKELLENKLDGWLIVCNEDSDIHSPWLLGVKSHALHFIYLDAQGAHQIYASQMETPMIKKSLAKQNIKAQVDYYAGRKEIKDLLRSLLKEKKVALNYGENLFTAKSTGFADYIHHGEYQAMIDLMPQTKFVSAAPIIWNLRTVKTKEDLKDLRETAKATMEILQDLPNWVKLGMTEKDLQAKLEYEYKRLGDVAFESIIASGPNSADPHHNSSMKKIGKGCLLIDSGLRINKMCSDITWTYWVGGEPPDDFKKAYNTLLVAKNEANIYFVEGENPKTPALKCREKIDELGYDAEELFIHGLGHPMGYETHDIGPSISWRTETIHTLKANMVYSNEPGLYWQEKWGIRLEDDIIVRKEKCEQVTQCPKDPIII